MAARKGPAPRKPARETSGEPPLTRERIVAAAVEILDAQGVDGLTMRLLAEHVGAGVMSLYWHVDNKEDVFDLALDTVLKYRRPAHIDPAPEWRDEVVHLLDDWRRTMLRHPWSAALLPRHTLGRNVLDRLEILGAILSRAGVADDRLNAAIWSLWNHVMGATVTRTSFDLAERQPEAAQIPARSDALHPTIARSDLLREDDWDGVFRQGVTFLLDGLAPRRT